MSKNWIIVQLHTLQTSHLWQMTPSITQCSWLLIISTSVHKHTHTKYWMIPNSRFVINHGIMQALFSFFFSSRTWELRCPLEPSAQHLRLLDSSTGAFSIKSSKFPSNFPSVSVIANGANRRKKLQQSDTFFLILIQHQTWQSSETAELIKTDAKQCGK